MEFETSTISEYFKQSAREENDKYNNLRENIIWLVANNKINEDCYKDESWSNFRNSLTEYFDKLAKRLGFDDSEKYKINLQRKGGRKYNYDFTGTITTSKKKEVVNIEFKYNSKNVKDMPQFLSQGKPSQYMTSNYEEYYYDNYLPKIAEKFNLEMPKKELYLKQIHSNEPKCMLEYKIKYSKGNSSSKSKKYPFTNDEADIQNYLKASEVCNESIESFISSNETELCIDKMNEKLKNSQKNKYYMLYCDGKFELDTMNEDCLTLETVTKEKNRFVCRTKSGDIINILLRWKNGKGIAFPAFQISFKSLIKAKEEPSIKEERKEERTIKKEYTQKLTIKEEPKEETTQEESNEIGRT